jgi:hypothetical protein
MTSNWFPKVSLGFVTAAGAAVFDGKFDARPDETGNGIAEVTAGRKADQKPKYGLWSFNEIHGQSWNLDRQGETSRS